MVYRIVYFRLLFDWLDCCLVLMCCFCLGAFCCVELFGILWFYAPDLRRVVVWFAWFGLVVGLPLNCYWLVWLCWLFFLVWG